MAQTPDGTPYVEGSDFVSGYPAVSQALAEQIDALRRMQPVGMITPYAGELKSADDLAAIDGWLPCDGKAYKRADFPDLYTRMSVWQVHTGFPPDTPNGSPNTANFYVPDFRGRSPIGAASGFGDNPIAPVKDVELGQRPGDWRTQNHTHSMGVSETSGREVGMSSAGNALWNVYWTDWSADYQNGLAGAAYNYQPSTGVNFIVWTGVATVGKSPISGVELAPVTTRMMIEARLEEAGISEDEIEMLRDQLAALKDGE